MFAGENVLQISMKTSTAFSVAVVELLHVSSIGWRWLACLSSSIFRLLSGVLNENQKSENRWWGCHNITNMSPNINSFFTFFSMRNYNIRQIVLNHIPHGIRFPIYPNQLSNRKIQPQKRDLPSKPGGSSADGPPMMTSQESFRFSWSSQKQKKKNTFHKK